MSVKCELSTGLCPDESCQTKLYISSDERDVECPNCGQNHTRQELLNVSEVTELTEAVEQILKTFVSYSLRPKKGTDLIKVHGLSNYQCKILSPLLTRYGMNKEGKAVSVQELGHGETVDCGRVLSKRAFLISPEHIEISGYGRDETGSTQYLSDLLEIIRNYNGGEERLIPIHADGDGHCLVHALSRAITGRELFWHALRDNLVNHLQTNLDQYRNLLKDFIDEDDWPVIMYEANPYESSQDEIIAGLGNIHIFALSNVLKRPIILLDSLEGIKNVADYTAIFVPAMVEAAECCDNMPLCIAWSGSGHNHFVPLVGVTDRPLPTIPQALLPDVWVIDKHQALPYLSYNQDGSLTVGGGKPLQKGYVHRLTQAMEEVFVQEHGVSANLVSDMHLYVFRPNDFVSLQPDAAIKKTVENFKDGRIFRCMKCSAINTSDQIWENSNFSTYSPVLTNCGGDLTPIKVYTFEEDVTSFECRQEENVDSQWPTTCSWCVSCGLRKIDKFGNILYENGDATETPAVLPSECCGKKHFWNGKEYEKIPKQFILEIPFREFTIEERVTWFYDDCELDHNSKGEIVAAEIVEQYLSRDDAEFSEIYQHVHNALSLVLAHHHEDTQLLDRNENELLGFLVDNSEQLPVCSLSLSKDPIDDIPSEKSVKRKALDVRKKSNVLSEIQLSQNCAENISTKHSDATVKQLPMGDDHIKIRINASDGRQKTLMVDRTLDYIGLQNTVHTHFIVKPTRQILKIGFPPKVIQDKGEDVPLALKHGDRVTVEIKSHIEENRSKNSAKQSRDGGENFTKSVFKTAKVLRDINLSEMRSQPSPTTVDFQLKAVSNMARISGLSEWQYAISHPEIFRMGGAYYELINLDIGLKEGLHCTLPSIPGMVFYYNVTTDEIELCLSQKGHHSIGPKITEIIHAVNSDCDKNVQGSVCVFSEVDQSNKENTIPPTKAMDSLEEKLEAEQGTQDEGAAHVEAMDVQGDEEKALSTDEALAEDVLDLSLISQFESSKATDEKCTDSSVTNMMKRQKGKCNRSPVKVPKLGPGFTIVGTQPTVISPKEAEDRRQELQKVLCSRKSRDKQ